MLNKLQVQLLPAGFHSNTSLAKRYKTGARPVVVMNDETKEELHYTPNRRQRRATAKQQKLIRKREAFRLTDKGKDQIALKRKRMQERHDAILGAQASQAKLKKAA